MSEPTDLTHSQSSLSPAPSSPSSSLLFSLVSLAASTGLSVYVIRIISQAWFAGLLESKYALPGILIATLPAGILGQVAIAAVKKLSGTSK